MNEHTCAACDCKLDANAIEVTIGGTVVEVCCEECAQKLWEATAAPLKTGAKAAHCDKSPSAVNNVRRSTSCARPSVNSERRTISVGGAASTSSAA